VQNFDDFVHGRVRRIGEALARDRQATDTRPESVRDDLRGLRYVIASPLVARNRSPAAFGFVIART
jgi:hypothetical protein